MRPADSAGRAFRCAALLAGSTALAGCVGGEKFESDPVGEELNQMVIAEMKLVAPLVTPELLDKCKALLEQPSWLGAKYEVAGAFQSSVRHSCFVQGRGGGLVSFQNDRKSVVFVAPFKKVAGAYGTGSKTKVAGCRFDLLDGKVSFSGLAPAQGHALNSCHRISQFNRASGRLQARKQQTAPGETAYVA